MFWDTTATSSSNDNYTYEKKSGHLWLFNLNAEYGYPQPFYRSQTLAEVKEKLFLFKD